MLVNATTAPGVPQIRPEEVDPFLALTLSRMFLQYRLEIQDTTSGHMTELGNCRRRLAELSRHHTVAIAPGKFMRWSGDALEVFECQRVTTTLRTTTNCHQDIPVHGQQPFAEVRTRILKGASPVVPCAREFPMRVRGLEQQWWRVDPHISKELAPQSWKGVQQRHPPTHMD